MEQSETLYGTDGAMLCPRCFTLAQGSAREIAMRKHARHGMLSLALVVAGLAAVSLASHSKSPLVAVIALITSVLLCIVAEALSPSRSLWWLWPWS